MFARTRDVLRTVALAGALVLPLLAACSSGDSKPTLTWYINPDNGGQARLAAQCSKGKPYTVNLQTWWAVGTRNGNEVISADSL